MARLPEAIWQGEHGSSLMSRHDIVCVHTIVGYAPAHAAHFSVKGDGTILQSRDTKYKSAANWHGNPRVIAIENEDHGPHFPNWGGSDVPALTPRQVTANAKILRWAHETHGVPLHLCPNSRPESRGLAYHRQGCDGNFSSYPGRVPGGELWSKAYGKVCPGDRRISQLPEILRIAQGATVTPNPLPPKDDHMSAEDVEKLSGQIDRAVHLLGTGNENSHYSSKNPAYAWASEVKGTAEIYKKIHDDTWAELVHQNKQIEELSAKLDAILAAVNT